jgi:hypothetical protein
LSSFIKRKELLSMSQIGKPVRAGLGAIPLLFALGLGCAGVALAGSINVVIDTPSLSGTPGDLAFDFIAGGSSLNTVTITGFSTDGTLGSATLTGSASGALPGAVTLTTADFFNEYLTGFTFGSILSFTFNQTDNPPSLGGTPDEFSFYLLDPTDSFSLVTTNDPTDADSLFASGSDQSLSVYTSPDETTTAQPSSSVPEPGTAFLCGLALFGLAALKRCKIRVSSLRWAAIVVLIAAGFSPNASAQTPNPSTGIGPPIYQYQSQGAALGGPILSFPATGPASGCVSYVANPPTGVPIGAGPDTSIPFSGCDVAVYESGFGNAMLTEQSLQASTIMFGEKWSMTATATERAYLERVGAEVQMGEFGPFNTGIATAYAGYYQQNLPAAQFSLVAGQLLALNIYVVGEGDSIIGVCVWSGNSQGCASWNFINDGPMGLIEVPPIPIAPSGLYTVGVSAYTTNATANSTSYAATKGRFSVVPQPPPVLSPGYTPIDAFDDPFSDTTVRRVSDTGEKTGVISPPGDPSEGWSQSPSGTFAAIVDPNDNVGDTEANDVNDSGTIVGSFKQQTGGVTNYNGFLLNNGSYSTYNVTQSLSTQIFGINNAGDFVGSFTSSGAPEQGFLQLASGGPPTVISFPNATLTHANGVNRADTVVGRWVDSANVSHGFVQTLGGTPLSFDFPGATGTFPYSITDAGTVSGHFTDSSGISHGFVGPPAGLVQYDLAGALQTAPIALNNQGIVGGAYLDSSGIAHGFTAQVCAPDISSNFTVSRGGFLLNHSTGELVQQITVTNTSGQTISGPILLLIRNLPTGVILDDGNQLSVCAAPGAPYLTVNPAGGALAPGQNAHVTANFANYSSGGVTYTISVLQGGTTTLP